MVVAVVACGPSARELPGIEHVDRVIAVNGAIEFAPATDWFTLDPNDTNMQRMAAPVDGVQYHAAVPASIDLPAHVRRYRRVADKGNKHRNRAIRRWSAKCGLSEDPRAIHTGNSAYGAVGLAYHWRPREIWLYGVDATQDERITGGRPMDLSHLPDLFASAMPQLKAAKIMLRTTTRNRAFHYMERL